MVWLCCGYVPAVLIGPCTSLPGKRRRKIAAELLAQPRTGPVREVKTDPKALLSIVNPTELRGYLVITVNGHVRRTPYMSFVTHTYASEANAVSGVCRDRA